MMRWINTRLVYDISGRLIRREGYWWDGEVHKAAGRFTEGEDWAFYNDDGSESGATIIGTKNVNITGINIMILACVGSGGGGFNLCCASMDKPIKMGNT